GGDGQMVIGGLVAALMPLYLPAPGPIAAVAALTAASLAAGLYAALAAWGGARHGIPTLISRPLLSYPAIGLTPYIVGFPLRDTTTGLAQTAMIPAAARLPAISGALNAGIVLIALIAAAVIFIDRRTVAGYEIRMRGQNVRFAAYGGVRLARQSIAVMFV